MHHEPMSTAPSTLDLLLAHADDGTPVLAQPLAVSTLAPAMSADAAVPIQRAAGNPLISHPLRSPNSLADQRWGLVVPAGAEGERLRAALQPLIAHRQEQQQAAVRVFTLPEGLRGPAVERWIRDEYLDPDIDPEERPRYLLLAGDLLAMPLQLQLSLSAATDAFVGRIALPRLVDYEAYAAKLLRADQRAAAQPVESGRGLFFSARDSSMAIEVGESALLSPCWDALSRKIERSALQAELQRVDQFQPGALLHAARTAAPSLLFTVSHGLGAPKSGWGSAQEQRQLQGALLCSTRPRELLTAQEVAAERFLADGIWLLFACFGAGTPQHSTYAPWLAELTKADLFGPVEPVLRSLPQAGEPPFLAALPQAALANPQGPLSIIGHIDLAWTFCFHETGSRKPSRGARFNAVADVLLQGGRAGVALRELHADLARFHNALVDPAAELTEDPENELLRRAYLRLQREDLRYFILLGDPAARLPVAQGRDSRRHEL